MSNEAKKVRYIVTNTSRLPPAYCPSCHKHIEPFILDYYENEDIVKYCPFCSQLLDWRGNIEINIIHNNHYDV